MAIWTKSEKIMGFMLVPITLWVVIVLATSRKVVNKVGSQAASVEPRLQQIEINQTQLSEIVSETIGLIELVHKIPKPAILYGNDIDEEIKKFENKIKKQKDKLKTIVNSNK